MNQNANGEFWVSFRVALPVDNSELAASSDPKKKKKNTVSWSRSEEHTSELQSLMRISYAVFCLKKKKHTLVSTKQYISVKIKACRDRQLVHELSILMCKRTTSLIMKKQNETQI